MTPIPTRIQKPATDFVNGAGEKLGLHLRISQGFRTMDEQAADYASGRTVPGPIKTNAPPGHSPHNFGLAIDVAPIVGGRVMWSADWNAIGALGKSYGFQWGGDWHSPKDSDHFEMFWK